MRNYFAQLRVYRAKDSNYTTLYLKVQANTLSDFEGLINAFGLGLRVANAEAYSLENLGFDVPFGMTSPGEFTDIENPIHRVKMLDELQRFLGVKRDRRRKEESGVTSENGQEEPTNEQ